MDSDQRNTQHEITATVEALFVMIHFPNYKNCRFFKEVLFQAKAVVLSMQIPYNQKGIPND